MIGRIAWRNIWRNKVRSLVVIFSVMLGIWAGTFIMSFSFGLSDQYVKSAIDGEVSHIQVHDSAYLKDKDIAYTIPHADTLLDAIRHIPAVRAACARTLVNGMVSSATTGTGVSINGIDPIREDSVTHLAGKVEEGNYFDAKTRNPVLISQRMADRLKVKAGNKIVLTFQDANGNITAGGFRICGIYHTGNSVYDDLHVFVRSEDLNRLAGIDAPHEIAVLLYSNDALDNVQHSIQTLAPDLTVQTWRQIAPELSLVIDSFDEYMYLFIAVILLALCFGIINTMLMAVLERIRELGMLMAVGMNKLRVFSMIMLETIFLALIGGPFGVFFAWLTVNYFGKRGINLKMFSKGFESYGMNPEVYTRLLPEFYFNILVMIILAAVLSAVYPSIKAIRIKPAQAIQKI